jgi:hypothetical protein
LIIKTLSRRSGTSQLIGYLFKYMLKEEKQRHLPEQLRPFIEEAKKYPNAKAFEKAMNERGLLYYFVPAEVEPQKVNDYITRSGIFGTGIYLNKTQTTARREAKEKGSTVKKCVVESSTKFFNAGNQYKEYLKLWDQIAASVPVTANQAKEVQAAIQKQLEREGYAGISTANETVVFDKAKLTELPKDFYKQAVMQKEHCLPQVAMSTPMPVLNNQKPLVITHNIGAKSVSGYIKAFEQNEAGRINKRSNSITVHHTIISFSNKDSHHVSEDMLKDIAKRYVELRGKDNLFVITPHYDRTHVHLHCAVSGVKTNGLSSRISQKDYADIKVKMDEYQKERYPQMEHSLPDHGKKKREKARETLKIGKIAERSTNLKSVHQLLETAYRESQSKEEFFNKIKGSNIEPYYRNGKLTGIRYENMKFRLANLGYDERRLSALGQSKTNEEKHLQELQQIRAKKEKEKTITTTTRKIEPSLGKQHTLESEFRNIREVASKEREQPERSLDSPFQSQVSQIHER